MDFSWMGSMASNTWNTELYDNRHAFVTKYGEDLVGLLAPLAGETILDIGCGTGHLARQIADIGAEVVGIDSSAEMIEAAQAAYPSMKWRRADVARLSDEQPAFAGRFDAVFSNAVLHWVSDAEGAARNMAAVLKPGGRLVVEFGGKKNIEGTLNGLLDSMEEVTGRRPIHDWYYPSIGEYTPLLERSGLEVQAAWLFDRPTKLEGPEGLRNWYRMFRRDWIEGLDPQVAEEVLARTEQRLRATHYHDDAWWADYRRIRVVSKKS
jgi:trans-aconitate methyltransferase